MDQNFERAGRSVEKAAHAGASMARDAKNSLTEMAEKVEIPAVLQDQIEVIRKQAQVALDRTEDLVKKHPFYSLLGAAAVGAIVASYMSSKATARWYKH